ncbi:MAG: OmpA family protein [Bacteroidota bacterium]
MLLEKGESITLRNVFFETSQSELLKESVVQLLALKRILEDNPSMKIELRGYTDNRGNDSYNMELSESRAKAVKVWLIEYGIEAQRLTSRGFGRKDPVESNETKAGRARNRRVEFFIVDM